MPAASRGAVVERVTGTASAVSIDDGGRDTGGRVGGEFWGGGESPRRGCTGSGEQESENAFKEHE